MSCNEWWWKNACVIVIQWMGLDPIVQAAIQYTGQYFHHIYYDTVRHTIWCIMYGLASSVPSVVIYMNYLNVVGGCHISKSSKQLKYSIWINIYQCMTSFASEFLRMNPIAVSMVMNSPRRSTHHIQGRIYGIFEQNEKHGSPSCYNKKICP